MIFSTDVVFHAIVTVNPAEAAATPEYGEVAKAVNGAKKQSEKLVPSTVGRLVKQVGADTTLKNAQRDGAQFAWVPRGDTCAFCLMLASRGWQYMSKNALKNGHAEHIHANCDCQYAVRFDRKSTVEGYDPDEYLEMYENAEGSTTQEKLNSMRRAIAAEKREKSSLQAAGADGIIALENVTSGHSIGAKVTNYDVKDFDTGEIFHFADGTYIQNVQVFAGKGTKKPLNSAVAEGLAAQIGGIASNWQHCKGIGVLDYYGEYRKAEVHWFQEDTVGKVKFKVKRWADES